MISRFSLLAILMLLSTLAAQAQEMLHVAEWKLSTRGSQNEVMLQAQVQNVGNAPAAGWVVRFTLTPVGAGVPIVRTEPLPTIAPGRSTKVKISAGVTARYANSGTKPTVNIDGQDYTLHPSVARASEAGGGGGAASGAPAAAASKADLRVDEVRLKTPGNGGNVTVIATVRNRGGAAGTASVRCQVTNSSNSSLYYNTQTVQVPANGTAQATFSTGLSTSQPLDTAGNSFLVSTSTTSGTIVKVDVQIESY